MSVALTAAVIAVVLLAATATGQSAGAPDPRLAALGRHLSQECTTCHRLDGTDNGIPSIIGVETDYFIRTLGFYRSGERNNPAMVSVAQSLDDEQIQALALYFSSLPKPGEPKSKGKAPGKR